MIEFIIYLWISVAINQQQKKIKKRRNTNEMNKKNFVQILFYIWMFLYMNTRAKIIISQMHMLNDQFSSGFENASLNYTVHRADHK
jgi:hypothetical protein